MTSMLLLFTGTRFLTCHVQMVIGQLRNSLLFLNGFHSITFLLDRHNILKTKRLTSGVRDDITLVALVLTIAVALVLS